MHLRYIKQTNAAVKDKPAGMAITTHLCRGNFRSSWVASGGYDFVAEALFSELAVDGFFLEYDDERSGGFEPLRFVPKGKMVVLGLVTTKRPELESKDDLKRRIDEAAKFVPAGPDLPVRPVRVLLHRGGQRADLRRAGGQAAADRGDRPRRLGRLKPRQIFVSRLSTPLTYWCSRERAAARHAADRSIVLITHRLASVARGPDLRAARRTGHRAGSARRPARVEYAVLFTLQAAQCPLRPGAVQTCQLSLSALMASRTISAETIASLRRSARACALICA